MKSCKYRNCQKELTGRKGKLYCNRSCKACEKTYLKREIQYLENKKKYNQDIVDMIKYLKQL